MTQIHNEYTMEELRALDMRYGMGLFSGDLYEHYKDDQGRPFLLYRNFDDPAEEARHVWIANMLLKKLYRRDTGSDLKAHIEWEVLNNPDKVPKKDKDELAKAQKPVERYKQFGTLHWGKLHELIYDAMVADDENTDLIISALGKKPPKRKRRKHPYIALEEAQLEDLFTEAPEYEDGDGEEVEVPDDPEDD